MNIIIIIALVLPSLAGVYFTFCGRHEEHRVARIATYVGYIYSAVVLVLIANWWGLRFQRSYSGHMGSLYANEDYSFGVSFFVDSLTCVWLFMVAFLGGIVIKYSQTYLHKDPGYQRFFACLMFMVFGQTLLAVAGGLDLLMAGWEFIGICSFMLIGFYRQRTQPVRNAFKVYCVYRFCDVGLLLSAWLSHVLWHDGQTFALLKSPEIYQHLADVGQLGVIGITAFILLAAAGKSAQFPFTFWLSRSMEGPTPSSAIFYGALSVHAGLFLLMRTYSIWHSVTLGPWLVGGLGLITVIVGSGIGRVQNNIKGQVAYSSAVHVGMMFIEVACGLKGLAMMHMFGNACLRCYQLLVSPSVVAYLLRLQGSVSAQGSGNSNRWSLTKLLPRRVASSLYVYSINDGFLESGLRKILWSPMTMLGRWIHRHDKPFFWILLPIAMTSTILINMEISAHFEVVAVLVCVIMMTGLTFAALAETGSAMRAWNSIALSNVLAAMSVWIIEDHVWQDLELFVSGVAIFWLVGVQALLHLSAEHRSLNLQRYHGLASRYPGAALMLFVGVLGVTGFPISPTFIGQDVLLHHAVDDYIWLAASLGLVFALNGLGLMRIYSKVCLGDREA